MSDFEVVKVEELELAARATVVDAMVVLFSRNAADTLVVVSDRSCCCKPVDR